MAMKSFATRLGAAPALALLVFGASSQFCAAQAPSRDGDCILDKCADKAPPAG